MTLSHKEVGNRKEKFCVHLTVRVFGTFSDAVTTPHWSRWPVLGCARGGGRLASRSPFSCFRSRRRTSPGLQWRYTRCRYVPGLLLQAAREKAGVQPASQHPCQLLGQGHLKRIIKVGCSRFDQSIESIGEKSFNNRRQVEK